MFIYMMVNKVNGKIYIGQTKNNFNLRFVQHKYTAKNNPNSQVISRAISKYGWESFSKHILERCETLDELNNAEIYWINFYNSKNPNGYNVSEGGALSNNVGDKNTNSRLNWQKVTEIRRMYENSEFSTRALGRLFGVSKVCISNIVNGKTWTDVPSDVPRFIADDEFLKKIEVEKVYSNGEIKPEWYAKRSGENHKSAKLTKDKVIEIRARLKLGELRKNLGIEFGVSAQVIGQIGSGKVWKF